MEHGTAQGYAAFSLLLLYITLKSDGETTFTRPLIFILDLRGQNIPLESTS